LTFQNHTDCPLTDFGGKTSIFSHPVYLFLRKFSLQDSRGGSVVVTQWPTGVKNCQQAGMDIGGCAVSVAGRNGKECVMVKSPYGSYGMATP
ncbi:TPA: hypothetical protein ACH01D_004851, partial [Escherichia coli]